MSAHDDLLSHGLTVYEVANVLEKHAHELAEEIRGMRTAGCFAQMDDCEGYLDAADLIDPEVGK